MSELREISEVNAKSARNESVSIGKVSVNYGTSVTGEDQSDPEVTILMPCLNESETLEVCIRKAQGFLDANQVRGEIVVSDNGSTDGSQEIARSCGARVVDVPIRGYGAALIYGSRAARGKYIIMGDSDDSYDFSDLLPFVREPHVALFGGESGFELYERIVADAARVLQPGGWLIMELGFGSRDRVAALLSGWRDVQIEPDLAGIPRVIVATLR